MPTWRISCECGEGFLYADVDGYGRFRRCHPEGRCEEQVRRIEAGGTVFRDPFECSRLRQAFEEPKYVEVRNEGRTLTRVLTPWVSQLSRRRREDYKCVTSMWGSKRIAWISVFPMFSTVWVQAS